MTSFARYQPLETVMKTRVPENGDDTERICHMVCPECNALSTVTVPSSTKAADVHVTCSCGGKMRSIAVR